jgi:Family of unknown function (DUF6502)
MKTGSIQSTLFKAIRRLLTPLVRILLRNGIAFGSFAEVARKVYVDTAFNSLADEGKKATMSRVSAMTGLTRKEVKRLHEMPETDVGQIQQRYNRAIRVISGWLNDRNFQDEIGQPARLPLEGADASFATLVRRYSGDVPPHAMLSILVEANSVRLLNGQQMVELIAHAYIPADDPIEKLEILGVDAAELIATIDHNLSAGSGALRFQRKVSEHQLDIDALPAFRALSAESAQSLLEELDHWLSGHRDESNGDGRTRYVSMGIYFYEEEDRS